MNTATLEALKNSIAHWERLSSGTQVEGESPYGVHCALCQEFLKDHACTGCPVAKATGRDHCEGSPWYQAKAAWGSTHFSTAAAVELAFLKSLLPKETQ